MLHLNYFHSGDALKDALFTAYGFILPVSVSTGEAALVVGLVNAGIVAAFRYLEMRRRDRRDQDLRDLRQRVAELTAAQTAPTSGPTLTLEGASPWTSREMK